MKEIKKRYCIPAKLLELLYTDDGFYADVLKHKKANLNSKFPKTDEWRDKEGFHLSFALAGYSKEDVSIECQDNILTIRGDGLDSIGYTELPEGVDLNSPEEYTKEAKPRIHTGYISRGIARRKFCIRYLVDVEFDVSQAVAYMEHGLLHISIPERPPAQVNVIEIKNGR